MNNAGYVSRPLALAIVVAGAKLLLDWFLGTETGLALRAAGANSRMASANGVNRARMVTLGLGISNAYVAVAGALFAQSEGFSDVTMGLGTIIIGLAAVIVGEMLVPIRTIFLATLAAVLGSIAYRIVIAFALNLNAIGLKAQDLNLVTALLVIAAIAISRARHTSLGGLRGAIRLPGSSRRARSVQKDA